MMPSVECDLHLSSSLDTNGRASHYQPLLRLFF
jgi:hypothetical protein